MKQLYLNIVIILLSSNAISDTSVLYDFNGGQGQEFVGWQWSDDVAYGNDGWTLVKNLTLGSGENFSWGFGPRIFNKGDYGKQNSAIIDTNERAPATLGGSLKVFETEESTDHRSTWWVWYDGKPLSDRGITNSLTNRMSFYLKTEGMSKMDDSGKEGSISTNFHIGTYLCWYNKDGSVFGSGDGCPYEGVGNQHYYHYLALNPGGWIHVLLDQHPQHLRGDHVVSNNPSYTLDNKNYFEHLVHFYMEIRFEQAQKTYYHLDELEFYSIENENEDSVTSLWLGYWPRTKHFEVGFNDMSFDKINDNSFSTFEMRWSDKPITNSNYEAATIINPLAYSGSKYVGSGNSHYFRRPSSWKTSVWTKFELENLGSISTLHVAIKDVSKSGEHIGESWPWNKGDGHDAPTGNIKTISYNLSPPPVAPTNISIQEINMRMN